MIKVPLTLGVEEEYQIIDPQSRELTAGFDALKASGSSLLREQLKAELLQSQIEVATEICRDVAEVRQELIRLRATVYNVAQEHGRSILAASTHPFSRWEDQEVSSGERYQELQMNMQSVARNQLVFGMHVHMGFGKSPAALELLIDVMNQLRYFLPHLLAITTSSPFLVRAGHRFEELSQHHHQGSATNWNAASFWLLQRIPRDGQPVRQGRLPGQGQ